MDKQDNIINELDPTKFKCCLCDTWYSVDDKTGREAKKQTIKYKHSVFIMCLECKKNAYYYETLREQLDELLYVETPENKTYYKIRQKQKKSKIK